MHRFALLTLSAVASLALSSAWAASASGASPTFSQNALRVTVTGSSVDAAASVRSNPETQVTAYGLCVRDAGGASVAFGSTPAVRITKPGVTTRATQTLAAGSYTLVPCLKVSGTWQNVGASKSFTIAGPTTPTPSPSPSPSPSSSPSPSPSTPSPWTSVYAEDFSRNAATGSVQSVYGANMAGYTDGSRTTYGNQFNTSERVYYPSKVLSVHDGALDYYLHTESGVHMSAAPVPQGWVDQTYGRYSVRMKADPLANYKLAFLLWPDSSAWGEGEIDFPEAGLAQTATGAVHKLSPGDPNQFTKVSTTTTFADWHVYTIEWLPGHVRLLIDGVLQKDFTADVPTTPHYWAMQSETDFGEPADATQGHVLIDWVTVDAYTG